MINKIIQIIVEFTLVIFLVIFANYLIHLGSAIEQIILIWVAYLIVTCKKNNIREGE